MKRTMTGLSVLLLSTILAPFAMAGSRVEPRVIKDTNPEFQSIQTERQTERQQMAQATDQTVQRAEASTNDAEQQANTVEQNTGSGGSERFRMARQAELDR